MSDEVLDPEARRQAIQAAREQTDEILRRYREKYGPETVIQCPVCGTTDCGHGATFRAFLAPGRTMAEMRAEIPDSPGPGNNIFTWRCANGHRWKMDGYVVDKVTVYDRWDLLPDA